MWNMVKLPRGGKGLKVGSRGMYISGLLEHFIIHRCWFSINKNNAASVRLSVSELCQDSLS